MMKSSINSLRCIWYNSCLIRAACAYSERAPIAKTAWTVFSSSPPSTVLPQNPAYRMKQEKYMALNTKGHLFPNLVICICQSVPEAIWSKKAVEKKIDLIDYNKCWDKLSCSNWHIFFCANLIFIRPFFFVSEPTATIYKMMHKTLSKITVDKQTTYF